MLTNDEWKKGLTIIAAMMAKTHVFEGRNRQLIKVYNYLFTNVIIND